MWQMIRTQSSREVMIFCGWLKMHFLRNDLRQETGSALILHLWQATTPTRYESGLETWSYLPLRGFHSPKNCQSSVSPFFSDARLELGEQELVVEAVDRGDVGEDPRSDLLRDSSLREFSAKFLQRKHIACIWKTSGTWIYSSAVQVASWRPVFTGFNKSQTRKKRINTFLPQSQTNRKQMLDWFPSVCWRLRTWNIPVCVTLKTVMDCFPDRKS